MEQLAKQTGVKKRRRFSSKNVEKAVFGNISELARYLGWGRHDVRALLDSGTIPHVKHGNRRVIKKTVVDKWLEGSGCNGGLKIKCPRRGNRRLERTQKTL
jgi:excisionase family DNA binding protein